MNYLEKFSPEEIQEAARSIKSLLDKYPLLNSSGWARPIFYADRSRPLREVLADREKMPEQHAESFLLACDWIRRNMSPSSEVCNRMSSYGLKHIAEEEIGYVRNGTFIAAALHCGLDFVPENEDPDPQNLCFKFSEESLIKKYPKYF